MRCIHSSQLFMSPRLTDPHNMFIIFSPATAHSIYFRPNAKFTVWLRGVHHHKHVYVFSLWEHIY